MNSPEKNNENMVAEKGDESSKGVITKGRKYSVVKIFRYGDWVDVVLMVLGTVGAIGDGMSTNCLLLFVSRLMNNLGYGQTQPKNHGNNWMDEVEKCSLDFVYLGLAVMLVAFLEGYCWSKTSERQVLKIRYKYLEAVLRQEVGFFDSQEATTSEVINTISKDTSLIQEVLSEKVPTFVMHSSVFISGLAFSTYLSWRLALVAFPTLLLLIIPGMIYGKYLMYLSKKSYKEYGKANTIVEQALSSIKTVYSFTAERRIVDRYSAILERTSRLGIKQGIAKGLAVGSTGLSFAIWGFLAWYGSHLVMYKGESGGRIYAAGISFVLSGLSLGMALPDLRYFTEAAVAATRIFDRIDRKPLIDGEDTKGVVLDNIRGELEFIDVKFTYPSRPNSMVLKDFNLKVEAGRTIALVGASGSGKSTAIALLQRFYDADDGVVRVDGVDIRTLQLNWIRSKMGLVSQEHALFGTSIKENIMFGKLDANMDEVTAAAMAANAHNFIRQLPEGYETKIGERGALLSGGQKQRIAIARAIIKNPVILLLDEATSALDSESEALVQNALDQASMGRTTLVVAHKLSTVRNADLIAVVGGGCIIEIGSHNDLINRQNGHYAKLAKLQRQLSAFDKVEQEQISVSSVSRSSAGRLSTPRSSPAPAFAKSPLPNETLQLVSHPPTSFYRLLSLNSPEWKQGLIGSLSAIAFGSVQPIYALTIGGMISAFFAGDGDSNNGNGIKLEKVTGRIELKKVDFAYPSRPETLVLRQFSLEVKPGTSTGLVGTSGCGKSTVIGLIQRFYDVERGSVKVDGVDIRDLDIQWYRRHTALVSQEPVIYSGTIRDNIVFGKLDVPENEVTVAARAANAHEFISSLKDGYDTECGERGVQLSGGQKQRIAIARAILRNPTVLLLDEATSALDVQSEQLVQEALDRIMVGRTTIVIAHRLNTIKNLDMIAFVADGKVVEKGTYAQLKQKRGAFFNLATCQR
ncbi:hypothetical protein DVH24_029349 [Malus domestica]|uniref:Uncharacterized protein n=1 Tax=Malus domestica TaxID=3750 RepID=A0A498HSU1_MALDO|nr:hypothetical protein DVH24_029349 [Malus domestica]